MDVAQNFFLVVRSGNYGVEYLSRFYIIISSTPACAM
jgi:hypothetical protein